MASDYDARSKPEDRHWFVAVNDVDVGPMDLLEVVARWQAGELTADSLVWKPGMLNWQPLSDVPELGYLATEPAPLTSPVVAAVRWETSQAVSLTALVAQELDAATVPQPLTTSSSSFSIEDAAMAGLPDITSLGFQSGTRRSSWESGWSPAAPAIGSGFFVAPSPWQAPKNEHRKRLQLAALIGAGFMVLTAGLILAMAEVLRAPTPTPSAVLGELPPATAAPAAEPALQAVATPPPVTVEEEPPARTEPEPVVAPPPKKEPARSGTSRSPRRPTTPKPGAAETSGTTLSRADILSGIKTNAGSLMPCLKAARSAGEISAGQLKLVLDWNIDPDGSVSGARLKGPPRLLNTSLRACFAAKMGQWQFPGSSRTSTVRNFGLPVNIR